MTNLMLSWQQAALLALGCGVAGMMLVYAGHVSRAWAWALHVGPFLREAGVVVGLYALWQLAGNLAAGGYHDAITHAWWIWDTERTLRLPSELDVQGLLLPHPLLSEIANLYYATMHFGMLIAMLVWLFVRHRDGYPAVRNAMAASTAICLLISFIPVAPPRFLPGAGIVDLAARYGESVYGAVGSNAGRRPVVRHAVGPRRLVDPGRLGRHHQGPQPLALADPAPPGRHRLRRGRYRQPLLGRRHRRGRYRRRRDFGAVPAWPPPPPGGGSRPGGRARAGGGRDPFDQ